MMRQRCEIRNKKPHPLVLPLIHGGDALTAIDRVLDVTYGSHQVPSKFGQRQSTLESHRLLVESIHDVCEERGNSQHLSEQDSVLSDGGTGRQRSMNRLRFLSL